MRADMALDGLFAVLEENSAFLFTVIALGAVALLVLHERVDPARRLRRRLSNIGGAAGGRGRGGAGRAVRDNAEAMEEKLARAAWGKEPDRQKFLVLGGIVGPVVAVLMLSVGGSVLASVIGGLALGIGSAWLFRKRLRTQRQLAIVADFPAVIETQVRGLRSGLTLSDTFRLIADEAPPAIAAEFRRIETEREVGLPITEVMSRFADRVPAQEIQYFATIVNLQSVTGSSLADTLETLNDTLHKRRVLKEKIRIMTADARSSAMILGALPFVVAAAMFFTSNDYISVLYTTSAGVMVMSCAAVYMLVGFLVMREMIKFDA